jgi:hypothetical protein
MGCLHSKTKEEREEAYRVKHHVPHDEISKKHSMERRASLEPKTRPSETGSQGRNSSNFGKPKDTSGRSARGSIEVPAPAAASTSSATAAGQINNYKPKRPKLDPKDFQFVNLKGEVKVKAPG